MNCKDCKYCLFEKLCCVLTNSPATNPEKCDCFCLDIKLEEKADDLGN